MDKTLTIVVPTYKEKDNITPLVERVDKALHNYKYRILLVDDDSKDGTAELVASLAAKYPVDILIRKNKRGLASAVVDGIKQASGDVITVMDADLQHPPELIPRLLGKWREGYHVVNTIRTNTLDAGPLKRGLTAAFYAFINRISDVPITPNAADFRLVDRVVLEELKRLREHTVFLRGLMNWVGFSQTAIEFEADRRFAGETKYSLGRMLKFALTAIISFSTQPLRLGVWSGLIVFLLSWIYGLWAVYAKFVAHLVVPGWTSTVWLIMLAASIQLFVLGIIAEYISQIYEETKGRPLFIVRENVGFARREPGPEDPPA